MDLGSNQPQSVEDNHGNTVFDPTTQFMDLMDDKSFDTSLESAVLDTAQSKQRPQLVKWSPQQGRVGDSITVFLKQQHQQCLHPLKIIFNNHILETHKEHRKDDDSTVWVTLMAKVPPLEKELHDKGGEYGIQTPVAVCLFDPANQQVVDHWPIGVFTYYRGNKRTADDASFYRLNTSTYAKKPHTVPSDYVGPSSGFDQGDFMKLLSSYDNNTSQEPTSPSSANSVLGRVPSPAAAAQQQQLDLPKAVSMPDMRKPNNEESQSSYATMFPGAIPPSPTNLGIHGSSDNVPQQQQQRSQKRHHDRPINIPQIMPRVSPTTSYPPQPLSESQYNNTTGYDSLGYPAYQGNNNTMAASYIQPSQPSTAPATASSMYDPSSHYFSPGQQSYNNNNNNNDYGTSSYFDQSNIMAAPPLTPPLQQKRLSHIQTGMLPPSSHHYPLIKSSRLPSTAQPPTELQQPLHHPFAGLVSRPQLNIHNDLMEATRNWTPSEWAMRRRLLRFWRQPNAQQIDCGFEILDEETYRSQRMQQQQQQGEEDTALYNVKDNLVVSCIYWHERNDYYITSVDCIQLIEGLIGVEFTVEEKNRIRRNLEALRPLTAAKTRPESVDFFKLIMGFPAPKPRNIEKDVKVFQWSTLGPAIKKIIGKYTPSYSSTASVVNYNNNTGNTDISSSFAPPPPPPPPPPQQQHYHFDTPRLSRS